MNTGLRFFASFSIMILFLLAGTGTGNAQAVDTDSANVGLEVSRECSTPTAPADQQLNNMAQTPDSCVNPTETPVGTQTPGVTPTVPLVTQLPETGSGESNVTVSIAMTSLSIAILLVGMGAVSRQRNHRNS